MNDRQGASHVLPEQARPTRVRVNTHLSLPRERVAEGENEKYSNLFHHSSPKITTAIAFGNTFTLELEDEK